MIYRVLFGFLDIIGGVLFSPVKFFRREERLKPERILLIRLDHIGDVVAATSVLEPLRKAFPRAVIDFMVPSWSKDIIKEDPFINEHIVFDAPWFDRKCNGIAKGIKGFFDMAKLLKDRQYDTVIDLRGDFRHIAAMFVARADKRISYGITGGGFLLTDKVPYEGTMHETDRNTALLKPLGVKCEASGVKLHLSRGEFHRADSLKKETGVKDPYAVVHVVPGHSAKAWDASRFSEVVEYLSKEKALQVVAVGSGDDKEFIRSIKINSSVEFVDLSGKTSLGTLAAILKGASLFVGVDSGPSHIAVAVGTLAVILFSGTNDPFQWVPKGDNVKIVFPGENKDLSSVSSEDVCKNIDEAVRV